MPATEDRSLPVARDDCGTPNGACLFTQEQIEQARRYHRPLYVASLVAIGLDLTVLALLTVGPFGGKLYGISDDSPWGVRALTFTALVLTLITLVGLPINYWAGYRHEHAWGFSAQGLSAWVVDRFKGFSVGLILGCCWLVGLIAAAHTWPQLWPVPVGLAAAALVFALGVVAPVVLEPLFNRFRPLDDPELAASLNALAREGGVPIKHVLVADASKRTRKVNAYVSGLGRTRRVVIYDTLLHDASTAEIHLVVAHELGHRRKRHIAKGMTLAMLGAIAFVAATWLLLESSTLRAALGITGAGDPRAIPFLLLLASVLSLLASPFGSALSRRWERQADAYSIQLTNDPNTFISTHHRLALTNLTDLHPPRLAYLAWASHPTPPQRIASAEPSPVAVGPAPSRQT